MAKTRKSILNSAQKRRITQLFKRGWTNVEIRDDLRKQLPKLTTDTIKARRKQYFKAEADKLVTELYKGQPCVICKSQGTINTKDTAGHHIVARSLSTLFRHIILNIIPLCPNHHTFSNEIAPHSLYPPAQMAFVEWLQKYMPKQYDILNNYKAIGGVIDHEKAYYTLRSYLDGKDGYGEDIFLRLENCNAWKQRERNNRN